MRDPRTTISHDACNLLGAATKCPHVHCTETEEWNLDAVFSLPLKKSFLTETWLQSIYYANWIQDIKHKKHMEFPWIYWSNGDYGEGFLPRRSFQAFEFLQSKHQGSSPTLMFTLPQKKEAATKSIIQGLYHQELTIHCLERTLIGMEYFRKKLSS